MRKISSRSLFSVLTVLVGALAGQVTSASAALPSCGPGSYPPVVCQFQSSGVPEPTITQAIQNLAEGASTTIGKTVFVTDANGVSQQLSVVETITKVSSPSGPVFTRQLTVTGINTQIQYVSNEVTSTGDLSVGLGAQTPITGSGFAAGTYVDVYIYSKGTYLGSFRVNSQGQFLDSVTIPTTLSPGTHVLAVVGKSASGKKLIFPAKIKVSNKVVVKAKTLSNTVFFDLNQAVITPDSKAKLKLLISQIPAAAKNIAVSINGYVQPTTKGAEWDAPLSLTRAQVTHNYLVALGLKNATYAVKGLGKYPLKSIVGRRADITITWK